MNRPAQLHRMCADGIQAAALPPDSTQWNKCVSAVLFKFIYGGVPRERCAFFTPAGVKSRSIYNRSATR